MKLRNKKTGEVLNVWSFYDGNQTINLKYFNNDGQVNLEYSSLAGLNEDWEDYKPVEPLIKDEEIRKAVIAWAKANRQQTRIAYKQLDETISLMSFIDFGGLVIEFNKPIDGLTSGKIYKFTELCGEEAE